MCPNEIIIKYIIIIIIIIIIITLVITLMHGSYLPETNHVSTVYSVAAVLYLQFVLPAKYFLYFHISTFRGTCAVPNTAIYVVP